MMSPILSSLSKSSRGPNPNVSSKISLTSRCRSLRFSSGFSKSQSCSTTSRMSLRNVLGSISAMRFMSSRSTSRMWIWRLSASYCSWAGSISLAASLLRGGGRRCLHFRRTVGVPRSLAAVDRSPRVRRVTPEASWRNGPRLSPPNIDFASSGVDQKNAANRPRRGFDFASGPAGLIEPAISRNTWCGRLPLATSTSGTPLILAS